MKNCIIKFRCTEQEKNKIVLEAVQNEMDLSKYVRQVLLNRKVVVKQRKPDLEFYFLLTRIYNFLEDKKSLLQKSNSKIYIEITHDLKIYLKNYI
ncbi:plasmid mobilization protein [Aureivirga sp. CE67]|uniref:plasmid mobilization protein n=1 Tax=Aureivirga sp. CE67 TaxID=1788983 RepID=UPI0018CAE5C1|nr:hypothetical protein [Aureivirga sp. CE67]